MITFPGLRRFVRLLKSKLFFAIAGCVSEGSTLAEAILMGTDAASDLNTFAENNHISFSQVLQDSLTSLYQRKQHA
ncbi:MAG: hypothetical protein HFH05_08775 [Lachnospiraceae bacterium]|nr:hypothetical protein [Lachnospiraceae bacterium]